MEFKMAENEKFIDVVSDPTLQLIFQKLTLSNFGDLQRQPQLPERLLKYSYFPNHKSVWSWFCWSTPTKATYYNRLNTEAGMRLQQSSLKLVIKEIFKTVKQYNCKFFIL